MTHEFKNVTLDIYSHEVCAMLWRQLVYFYKQTKNEKAADEATLMEIYHVVEMHRLAAVSVSGLSQGER